MFQLMAAVFQKEA